MKNFILLSLIFCCTTSCSDDSDPMEGSLIGTWDLIGMTSESEGETHTMPQEEIDDDPLTYVLNEDSTGIQYYKGKTDEFEWVAEQNTLVFSTYNTVQSYTFTVDSENLRLTFPISKYTITHIFQRN